jgi:hypothetical protein
MRFARTEIGAKSARWRHLHGAQKGSGLLGGRPLVNGVKTVMVNETLMAVRSLAPVLRDSVNVNPDLESHGEI